MAGALESSITLDEVFAMVGSKRVPLAAELAGYLALEISEGADDAGGDVDPKSVYIAEEGTVAIVTRREALSSGDAEASIRATLGRLLDASGSKTTALTAASRRRSTGNLRALSEELEAALIPVNRAAGRRALARLAREVRRMTLRAGRAGPASVGAVPAAAPAPLPPAAPPPPVAKPTSAPPPPVPPPRSMLMTPEPPVEPPSVREKMPEEAPTARREALPELVQSAVRSDRGDPPPSADPPALPPTLPPLRRPPTGPKSLPYTGADVDSLLEDFARASERPDQAVARDLKAMAGLDPTPPPPSARISSAPDAGVEALLAMSDPTLEPPRVTAQAPAPAKLRAPSMSEFSAADDAPTPRRDALALPTPDPDAPRGPTPEPRLPQPRTAPMPQPRLVAAVAPRVMAPTPEPMALPHFDPARDALPPPRTRLRSQADLPTEPGMRQRQISKVSTGEFRRMSKRRSDLWLVLLLLVLLGLGVGVVWSLKPGFLTGRTPEKIAQEKAAAEEARQKAAETMRAQACKVALHVTDAPTNAEILVRQGQAPVDVERMPVGARLEFVATAEGFAPKRAVVPSDASWDTAGGGTPRFEVAVQLDKSTGKKAEVWPPGDPGSEVGGKGSPGTVHVVTTPRGAEVWLLTGLGPDARIEGLACDQDIDVLVAGPTTLRKRLHVSAASFTPGPEAPPEGRFAKVSAK